MTDFDPSRVRSSELGTFSTKAANLLLKQKQFIPLLSQLGYPVESSNKGYRGVCPVCRDSFAFLGTGGRIHPIYWRCLRNNCAGGKYPANLLGFIRAIVPGQGLGTAIKAIAAFLGCEQPFDITNGKFQTSTKRKLNMYYPASFSYRSHFPFDFSEAERSQKNAEKFFGYRSDAFRFAPLPKTHPTVSGGALPAVKVRSELFGAVHKAICRETRSKGYQCCMIYAGAACILLRALTGSHSAISSVRSWLRKVPQKGTLMAWEYNSERYPHETTLREGRDIGIDHVWVEAGGVVIDLASWQFTRYFRRRWVSNGSTPRLLSGNG